MAGEELAFRRAALGAPIAEYGRIIDRTRVNRGGQGTKESAVVDAATSLMGVTTTAHATPHTMGTAVELVASTAFDAETVEVLVSGVHQSTVNTSTVLDIVTGASLNVPLIQNLMIGYLPTAAETQVFTFRFPVRIPAGTRVGAQVQGAVTVQAVQVGVRLHQSGEARPGTLVTPYGVSLATSNGTVLTTAGTINTASAWTSIGTTTKDHRWITVALSCTATATITSNSGFVELGIGASPSEVLIPGLAYGMSVSEQIRYETTNLHRVNLPSGTEISARYQSTSTAAAAKPNVAFYGID